MANPLFVVPAPNVDPLAVGTLLDAAQRPASNDFADRWMAGITWQPRPARDHKRSAVDTCNPADFTNPAYACTTAITQTAFQIYDAFNASSLDHTPEIIDGYLTDRVRIQFSAAIGQELHTGTASGGRSLASTAHAPSQKAFGAAAVSVVSGLAILEEELAHTLYGGQGLIHMSPGLVGLAAQNNGLRFIDGQWYTAMGHRVVADAGYIDTKEPTGQAASAVGTEWMYASGPVTLFSTNPELMGGSANEYMDMTRNKFVRWLNAYALLQFDPAPVTAVLVSY
jgi:hypothetical protein